MVVVVVLGALNRPLEEDFSVCCCAWNGQMGLRRSSSFWTDVDVVTEFHALMASGFFSLVYKAISSIERI